MNPILLDTNVVSETMNTVPEPRVAAFMAERDDLWLPTVVIYELEYGLQLLPEGRRRRRLASLQAGIIAAYADRILPLSQASAEWAAILRVRALRSGRTVDIGDSMIAGIARANGMAVATRNVRHFEGLGLEVINPWEW